MLRRLIPYWVKRGRLRRPLRRPPGGSLPLPRSSPTPRSLTLRSARLGRPSFSRFGRLVGRRLCCRGPISPGHGVKGAAHWGGVGGSRRRVSVRAGGGSRSRKVPAGVDSHAGVEGAINPQAQGGGRGVRRRRVLGRAGRAGTPPGLLPGWWLTPTDGPATAHTVRLATHAASTPRHRRGEVAPTVTPAVDTRYGGGRSPGSNISPVSRSTTTSSAGGSAGRSRRGQ